MHRHIKEQFEDNSLIGYSDTDLVAQLVKVVESYVTEGKCYLSPSLFISVTEISLLRRYLVIGLSGGGQDLCQFDAEILNEVLELSNHKD